MPADLSFNPAETLPETAARMFALTAAQDTGTQGPKRALVALATALGLDVDLADVNAILGQQIVEALGAPWHQARHYLALQVTPPGMDTMLQAATENFARLSTRQRVSQGAAAEVLRALAGFHPAASKQEAVSRICDLAGAPTTPSTPGARSKEQGARSKEQGARSKEQGARSKEQGASLDLASPRRAPGLQGPGPQAQ